jgi:hypothetical protein
LDPLARVLIDARGSRRALHEAVEDALVGACVKVCLDHPELDENTAYEPRSSCHMRCIAELSV